MNAELLQLVVLITHGNEFLTGRRPDAPELFPSHPAFHGVGHLSFRRIGRGLRGGPFLDQEIATDTRTWFRALQASGIKRLRMALVARADEELPEPIAAAFIGGGTWAIQADAGDAAEVWRSLWSVQEGRREPKPAEQRLESWLTRLRRAIWPAQARRESPGPRGDTTWSVSYVGVAHYPCRVPFGSVQEATGELEDALRRARDFARGMTWEAHFSRALELLGGSAAGSESCHELLPASFRTPEVCRLLAGALASWVFGGMGSWNDLSFEDETRQKAYDAVTRHLYQAVLGAMGAVANATAA